MGRRVDEAWSDIQVQMKRRYDLIPNLVETMKGFMTHERGTLDSLTQARAAAVASDGGPGQQAQAETVLQGALRSLFAMAESCPALKTDPDFLALRHEVADTGRSEEHTSELQSLMRISYAVFCLKKKQKKKSGHRQTREKETQHIQ